MTSSHSVTGQAHWPLLLAMAPNEDPPLSMNKCDRCPCLSFSVFIECVTVLLLLYVLAGAGEGRQFGREARAILVPWPGMEPSARALEGRLSHWTSGEAHLGPA